MDESFTNRDRKVSVGERKFSLRASPGVRAFELLCEVCKNPTEYYCTMNICQKCCEEGLCPYKEHCRRYPSIIESILKRRKFDPSRRDVNVEKFKLVSEEIEEEIDLVELLKFLKKKEAILEAFKKIPKVEKEEFPQGKKVKKENEVSTT